MAGGSLRLVLETPENPDIVLETAVDVQEVRKLDAYLKRLFGNPKIRVVPRPKKDDSAEVYIGDPRGRSGRAGLRLLAASLRANGSARSAAR
jgi:hypothetical protein